MSRYNADVHEEQVESPAGRPQGAPKLRIRLAIRDLVHDRPEHRRERRIPFFGPVLISPPDAPETTFSAFARDLSPHGIGLVHLMPLERVPCVINLPTSSGRPIAMLTEIVWCRDFGDGWYASGGRFVDVVQT